MTLPRIPFSVNRGTVLFGLIGVILVLQVYQLWKGNKPVAPLSAVPLASTTPVEIFSSQTATIRGKIVEVNGNALRIENDQNVTGNFDAGRIVLINDATELTVASSSADLKKIKTNQDATINLLYADGSYVVTSLTYR